MTTELLDEYQGNNPDCMAAREFAPEPYRCPHGDMHHFMIASQNLDFEAWIKEEPIEYSPIKTYSFHRVLVQLPGVSFWAWRSSTDGKIYM